ncbi:MAG: translation elongation factor Ts [Myxococcota bacterium]|nr:translation elongation factor Ts [Myxococcota bacterium]
MANVTAQQVKSLRDRTGAGMNDCRNALIEAEGHEENAVEIIQKKGLAKALKKAGAIAAEGLVHSYIHSNARIGVLVEVNCQTDFVARNEDFKQFVNDVGLQIASSSPLYVRREEVPADDKEKQLTLFRGQLDEDEAKTGKKRPEAAVAKILEGKLDKWFSEVCLNEQELVTRDDKKTVGQLADDLTAKIGERITVRRFTRYELGEGIEKKTTNLADEVAEQLASMS